MTPYTEGRLAGYRGTPRNRNPYLKGVVNDGQYSWALDWIRGHIEGQDQARDDVIRQAPRGHPMSNLVYAVLIAELLAALVVSFMRSARNPNL